MRGGREDLCSQTEESVDEEEGKKSRKSLQPLESHSAPLAPGQRLSGGVDRETGFVQTSNLGVTLNLNGALNFLHDLQSTLVCSLPTPVMLFF